MTIATIIGSLAALKKGHRKMRHSQIGFIWQPASAERKDSFPWQITIGGALLVLCYFAYSIVAHDTRSGSALKTNSTASHEPVPLQSDLSNVASPTTTKPIGAEPGLKGPEVVILNPASIEDNSSAIPVAPEAAVQTSAGPSEEKKRPQGQVKKSRAANTRSAVAPGEASADYGALRGAFLQSSSSVRLRQKAGP